MKRDEWPSRAVQAGRRVAAVLLVLSVVACAGYEKEKIHQQYAGATVVDKKIVSRIRQEPIRIVSYVLPNGQIICEGEYGEIRVGCAMQKAQVEKKYNIKVREIVRDSGQTRPVQYDEYYLVLKNPEGLTTTHQVNDVQFRETLVGERLGLKSTDPAARRAALTTEIAAAERELAGTVAQVEAKEAERARAKRSPAASKRPAKGGNKGDSTAGQSDESALTRLNRELEELNLEREDKELRLTQLRQERDALDKPAPAATPAPQQPAAPQ